MDRMIVLVIEDSVSMRQLICHVVQRIEGAIVFEAIDGTDGLAKLAEIHPDVIMTDINMPGMDGFAFIARVRQLPDHRDTPVIVMTTESAAADRERARDLGVTTYVTKPIRRQDVVDAITSVVGARQVINRTDPPAEAPAIVLHVDYDDAQDLLGDYDLTLSRGQIAVSNGRALPAGTEVRIAVSFPGLAEPILLDGAVRSSGEGDEPTLDIELGRGPQRERFARAIESIRAAAQR